MKKFKVADNVITDNSPVIFKEISTIGENPEALTRTVRKAIYVRVIVLTRKPF